MVELAAGHVAVVTDSTSSLSLADVVRHRLTVVPLEVIWAGRGHSETDLNPEDLIAALNSRSRVTTSRPSPQEFAEVYSRLAAHGATEIVSVHLSAVASGTCDAARAAADGAPVPVHVVDSRQLAMGTGYAAVAAARAAAAGLGGPAVAAAAQQQAASCRVVFAVETLEHLRRGGRISLAGAVLGSALAVKPLLEVADGQIRMRERTRTSARARQRLVELAVEAMTAVGGRFGVVQATVQHLGAVDLAHQLAERVSEELGVPVAVRPVSAVIGAHAGPGVIGVAVARESPEGDAVG